MRKTLGKILQWTLLGVLCLSIPSALADPINTISGIAGKNTTNVWSHAVSVPIAGSGLTSFDSDTSPQRSTVAVGSLLIGCAGDQPDTETCGTWSPILQQDPNADGLSDGNNALYTFGGTQTWNGLTWDRTRSNAGDGATRVGIQNTGPMLWTGGAFQNARTIAGTADASTGTGIASSGLMIFNGTTWDRVRSSSDSDASGTGKLGVVLQGVTNSAGPGGGNVFNVLRTAGANALAFNVGGAGVLLNVPYSSWSVTNTPAAATQATASRAAGAAGVRHVATTITACFSDTAAEPTATVNLRDGATGAGTVLRTWFLGISAANDSKCVDLPGLAMLGTAATAMTLEFAAAGSANSIQTVTLTGFSTN